MASTQPTTALPSFFISFSNGSAKRNPLLRGTPKEYMVFSLQMWHYLVEPVLAVGVASIGASIHFIDAMGRSAVAVKPLDIVQNVRGWAC